VNSIDNQRVTRQNHELTGKKPAKLEIYNKPNVIMKPQYPYNPPPENQISKMNQWYRQNQPANAYPPEK
jgi:hypothetical protein